LVPERRTRIDPDEGLATDRTALAWERMAIASVAVAAIVIRQGVVIGPLGLAIPLAGMLVLAALLEWRLSARFGPAHHYRSIRALAVLTVILSTGAAVLVSVG
jgi:uncharacterized membrane protein YidH (DUF202 family)